MSQIPDLLFRFKRDRAVQIPVDEVIALFDRIKDRASGKVELRQYMKSPTRLDDLSEIELVAIVSVVNVVQSASMLSASDIITVTELTREWVKECYRAWEKTQPAAFFDQLKVIDEVLTETNKESIAAHEEPGGGVVPENISPNSEGM